MHCFLDRLTLFLDDNVSKGMRMKLHKNLVPEKKIDFFGRHVCVICDNRLSIFFSLSPHIPKIRLELSLLIFP